jgi:hypothetical protein
MAIRKPTRLPIHFLLEEHRDASCDGERKGKVATVATA